MIKTVLGAMIMMIASFHSIGQHMYKISGKVTAISGSAVAGASAILMQDSNLVVKAEPTTADGQFSLEGIANGMYYLQVSQPGFESYISSLLAVSSDTVLPEIVLSEKTTDLKEVSVRALKPFIEVKADKIVVNVESSIASAGSSVLDVLRRSPGVTINQNDNIALKGKQGVLIMIDGKLTPVAGENLTNMLKSMPAESIGEIEIISNPSARYDAAGTAGIINIKTKRDKRAGLNGSINSFYGQGVYPKAGAGATVNYRNGKCMLNASYNFSYRQGFNHLTLFRSFYERGQFQNAYDQDNNSMFKFFTNTGTLALDYSISTKTTVGVNSNIDLFGFTSGGRNFSRILGADYTLNSYFTTRNNSDNHNANYAVNANLRHQFDSSGRTLTADLDYGVFSSARNQFFTTLYLDKDGRKYLPDYLLAGDLNGETKIYSVKADYTQSFRKGVKLEAGIKSSYVTQDNEVAFYDESREAHEYDSTKSNHFLYREHINAAYLNTSKDGAKWSAQAGLRVEQTLAAGEQKINNQSFDRHYAQLFPSFAVQRHIDPQNDLGVTLSRRITRPNYEQLNPFKYYLDPSTYATGYPFLMPELIYNGELSYTYKQRYTTALAASYLTHPITEVIQPSDDTSQKRVTVQTTKNLDKQYFYSLSGSYQFQFTKWWSNITNFNCYYSQFIGNIASSPLSASRVSLEINTNNTFLLPKAWSAELGYFRTSKQVYGYMVLNPMWSLSAGVQKHLFNKKATLKLNATDIFWHSYPSAKSVYSNYVETFVAKRETRQFTISFTYRFGKPTGGAVRRRSGAEDEKRRAGTGNS